MSRSELIGLLVTTAALFGWVSRRWLKLPITIGTMMLTVIGALALLGVSARDPAVHGWAMQLVGEIDFENLILHGMLGLLLFGGIVSAGPGGAGEGEAGGDAAVASGNDPFDGNNSGIDVAWTAAYRAAYVVDGVPVLWSADLAHGPDCSA